MKWKRCIAFFMLITMLFCSVPTSASAASVNIRYLNGTHVYKYSGDSYKVYYNNKLVNNGMRPALLKNGDYLIPYEYALVNNGPKISASYIATTKCIQMTYGAKSVKMYVDKKYMYVNNVRKTIKVAPARILYSSSSYIGVPLSALKTAFGFKYTVVKGTKSIYITGEAATSVSSVKASSFKSMSTSQFIAKMGPIAQQDYHNTGILASVTLAQAILESGWGKSGLTQVSNNLFGIKASTSKSTWKNSTWTGQYVTVKTKEEYSGKVVTITARFRKYSSVADSIADHSAYLRYSKNGSKYRYAGITSTKSYMTQLRIIKNGGYATSSNYVSQLASIIKSYNLTKWDK